MRDRLVELISEIVHPYFAEGIADKLIENGVILAPMPMAEWLRKELTEYVYQRCFEEL
jgi:hypothetical protein